MMTRLDYISEETYFLFSLDSKSAHLMDHGGRLQEFKLSKVLVWYLEHCPVVQEACKQDAPIRLKQMWLRYLTDNHLSCREIWGNISENKITITGNKTCLDCKYFTI